MAYIFGVECRRLVFITATALAAILPLAGDPGGSRPSENPLSIEWAEAMWLPEGASVVRRPLTAVEERFANRFPGAIGRFADARQEWIVRVVNRPTRLLHPAADCFRGLGYTVRTPQVTVDAKDERWSCFAATRDGHSLQVCERIFDLDGGRWTDTSAWYWSSLLGRKQAHQGPWWAVTRVEVSG